MKFGYKPSPYLVNVLLIFAAVFACSFNKQKNDVSVVDATYENWTSGVNGGGSGTEYYIRIAILSSNNITFDSLWINKRSYKTYIANSGKGISSAPITFAKNDTITLRVSATNKVKSQRLSKAPINFKGDALLRYHSNNKQCFLVIKKLTLVSNPNQP